MMVANSDAVPEDEELGQTFRTLSPWLQARLAARHGMRREDAEDLVQESFVRLGRYMPADRSHPKALLMRIAVNLARDARRRFVARHSDRHISMDDLPVTSPVSLVQPADQAMLLDLKSAILGLPEPLRETFLLARFTPLTQAEIAARLGISTKAVEWRISKAVAICLARLEY